MNYLEKLAEYNTDVYVRLEPIIKNAVEFDTGQLTDLTGNNLQL